ncbi:MAG: hypothetical protein K6G19_08040 [Lachnospiraceae bacterium]|nr:hypothetical protein [Lachnospiraceae bacterium]
MRKNSVHNDSDSVLMRKLRKILLAVCIIFLAAAVQPLSALAAPEVMPDGSIFDAQYYADNNPDVVNALGRDKNTLYQHYLLFGKAEGRLPYDPSVEINMAMLTSTVPSSIVDARVRAFKCHYFYKDWYDEVYQVPAADGTYTIYGRFLNGHLLCWGPWTYYPAYQVDDSMWFDAARYAADYPAVAAQVGTSKEALWNHYRTTGVYQGLRAHGTSELAESKQLALDVAEQIAGNPSLDDYGRIKAVHDWISVQLTYSYNSDNQGIADAIVRHQAVCGGYADLFDFMVSSMGYQCDYIYGYGNGGEHAWNRVMLNGVWYYVDACWDDEEFYGGKTSYRYFMISESQMAQDHVAEEYWYLY